jgi:hypothetical protein
MKLNVGLGSVALLLLLTIACSVAFRSALNAAPDALAKT